MEREKISGMTLVLLVIVAFSAVIIMPETARAADPPVLDGLIDSQYYHYGEAAYHANVNYPQADGFLFAIDNTSIDHNYIWAVWILNASYNDNSYGDEEIWRVGWPKGHLWSDLVESDMQQIVFKNCTGAIVFNANFDVVSPGFATNSTYDVAPWGTDEALIIFGNGSLVEYNTSTAWNVNYYWDTLPYIETDHSPTPHGNYTPHENYTDWEFRIIWEIRMDRELFGGCGINVSETEFLEIHASPNKLKISPPPLNLTSCLGDFVWEDTDNDGIQDPGEPVIRDATVSLYYSNNTFIRNTTTDWWGFYKFTNLTPGNYYVKFYNPDTSYYIGFSSQDTGTNDKRDSDADTTTGQTYDTTLEADETDLTWDCGLPPVPDPSQSWFLHNDSVMYKENMSKPEDTVTVSDGGSTVWSANEQATVDVGFLGGTWTGTITLDTAFSDNFTVKVGSWNGSAFSSAGSQLINGDGSTTYTLSIPASAFTVQETEYLALQISPSGADLKVKTGDGNSYVISPETDPGYPVPELSTLLLLSIGLITLAGYVLLTKRRK